MALVATARDVAPKTVIRAWHMGDATAVADTVGVDTAYVNLPMREPGKDYALSSADNGQLVSPMQARDYFARTQRVDDPFGIAYDAYTPTARTVRFYNTTMPFSSIAYKKGFKTYHEDNDLQFFFTGNLNRRTNLGLGLNYLTDAGHYRDQAGKTFYGQVFGSYNGDHYAMHAAFMWNNLSHFDNGGIRNVQDLAGPLKPEDIPTRLNAMVGYRYLSGYMNHSYSITTTRLTADSDTVHVPVMTFNYSFECNNSNRRYIEHQAQQGFYPDTYHNPLATRDSSDVLTIGNTVSATFEEEFNRVLRFGATVYAYNETQRHLIQTAADTLACYPDSAYRYHWSNNLFVGGALYKNRGRWVHYGFDGRVCVVGYKIGEFSIDGHVDGDFRIGKDTMYLTARAAVRNETPSYYYRHYAANHRHWDDELLGKTYHIYAGATVRYPTQWVKPSLSFQLDNISRMVWVDATGTPRQYDGNIQVLSGRVDVDITTPWVNLENKVLIQYSSRDSILSLPTAVLYHNLYYHGWWAHKALYAQIGADMRFFSRYHAPLLDPSTSLFRTQNEVQIGNYPVVNIYANFYVRSLRLRLFAQYQHVNRLFMKSNTNYQSMPGYAMNPDVFRAGAAWQFYK